MESDDFLHMYAQKKGAACDVLHKKSRPFHMKRSAEYEIRFPYPAMMMSSASWGVSTITSAPAAAISSRVRKP